ncbi:MAG TPA: helix-turn-helix domain-containing protein [Chloroflexota bacterium]|nr:helix-turn-helix domain-containing protein [Chloroflexota bacterium]
MTTQTWRRRQALETRRQIVRAARRLFVSLGYVGTTVEAIAAEAGVAVPTVYKAFGTKAAIARELNDLIDEEAGVAAYTQRVALASQPTELIAAAVALNLSLHEHCGDIIEATRAGAAVDATLAHVYAEGTRRHDDGMRSLIDSLQASGALRAELEPVQAVGLLSSLCAPEVFAELTRRHGWTVHNCEAWTVEALCWLLLRPVATRRHRSPATQPRTAR